MDFTEMPESLGYNYILVVVDRFSKEVVFVLCTKEETAYSTAELFRDHVWWFPTVDRSLQAISWGSCINCWASKGRCPLHSIPKLTDKWSD